MRFYVTRDVPEAVREQLIEDCKPHLAIDRPQEMVLKSADAPSYIQIVADALEWLPLTAPATVFLTQLAKRAADEVWDNKARIAEALKDASVAPLKRVLQAFVKARRESPAQPDISITLPIPDDHFGTGFTFTPQDEEDAATVLARFVVKAKEIEVFMQREAAAGRAPLGRAQVLFQDDGSIVIRWMDQGEMKRHEHRIDP